jgi:hypothetical protein
MSYTTLFCHVRSLSQFYLFLVYYSYPNSPLISTNNKEEREDEVFWIKITRTTHNFLSFFLTFSKIHSHHKQNQSLIFFQKSTTYTSINSSVIKNKRIQHQIRRTKFAKNVRNLNFDSRVFGLQIM